VDRDPVRSPDGEPAANPAAQIRKEGEGYVLRTEVEEVELYCTVLEGNRLVPDLKKENFEVYEDGVKQNLISFQHTDLPVSIALVVDNSGSMSRKRPSVNKSAMDLIEGLQSAGRGLCGELFRRGFHRPGFYLRREQAARRAGAP
jgi:Ca-activated chloride channel homolog